MSDNRTTVVQVSQSPMNARRWLLRLACGHEFWMTSVRRPKMVAARCQVCPPGKRKGER